MSILSGKLSQKDQRIQIIQILIQIFWRQNKQKKNITKFLNLYKVTMNLSQIERRYRNLDFRTGYTNYKFNPRINKIGDLKQNIYKELAFKDSKADQSKYGLACFVKGDPMDIIKGIDYENNKKENVSVSENARAGGVGVAEGTETFSQSQKTRRTNVQDSRGGLLTAQKSNSSSHYSFKAARQRPLTSQNVTSSTTRRFGEQNQMLTSNRLRSSKVRGSSNHLVAKSRPGQLQAAQNRVMERVYGRSNNQQGAEGQTNGSVFRHPNMSVTSTNTYQTFQQSAYNPQNQNNVSSKNSNIATFQHQNADLQSENGDTVKVKEYLKHIEKTNQTSQWALRKTQPQPQKVENKDVKQTKPIDRPWRQEQKTRKIPQENIEDKFDPYAVMEALKRIKIPDVILSKVLEEHFQAFQRNQIEMAKKDVLMKQSAQNRKKSVLSRKSSDNLAAGHNLNISRRQSSDELKAFKLDKSAAGHDTILDTTDNYRNSTFKLVEQHLNAEKNFTEPQSGANLTNKNRGGSLVSQYAKQNANQIQQVNQVQKINSGIATTTDLKGALLQNQIQNEKEIPSLTLNLDKQMKMSGQVTPDDQSLKLDRTFDDRKSDQKVPQPTQKRSLFGNKDIIDKRIGGQEGESMAENNNNQGDYSGSRLSASNPQNEITGSTSKIGQQFQAIYAKENSNLRNSGGKRFSEQLKTSDQNLQNKKSDILIKENQITNNRSAAQFDQAQQANIDSQNSMIFTNRPNENRKDQSPGALSRPDSAFYQQTHTLDAKLNIQIQNQKTTNVYQGEELVGVPGNLAEVIGHSIKKQSDQEIAATNQQQNAKRQIQLEGENDYGEIEDEKLHMTNFTSFAYPTEMLFNVKITDLSTIENRFVILADKKLDENGFIQIIEQEVEVDENGFEKDSFQLNHVLPWLESPSSLENRSLKIEVTFKNEIILLRFIHLGSFYPRVYQKIALQIANNLIQNNFIRLCSEFQEKKTQKKPIQKPRKKVKPNVKKTEKPMKPKEITKKVGSPFNVDLVIEQTKKITPQPQTIECSDSVSRTQGKLQISPRNTYSPADQNANQNENVVGVLPDQKSFDDELKETGNDFDDQLKEKSEEQFGQNIQKDSSHDLIALTHFQIGMIQVHQNDRKYVNVPQYFSVKPQPNELLTILEEIENYKLQMGDLEERLSAGQLLQFPQVMKDVKVIIEYSDCILHAKDFQNYQMLIDDNKDRAQIAAAQVQQTESDNIVKIKQISPKKEPEKLDGIIKEHVQKTLDPEKAKSIPMQKMYSKSKEATFFILRSTNDKHRATQKQTVRGQPQSAINMKTQKQIHELMNKNCALETKPIMSGLNKNRFYQNAAALQLSLISEYSINGGLVSPMLSQSTTKPMSLDAHLPQAASKKQQGKSNILDSVSSMMYYQGGGDLGQDQATKGINFSTSIANLKAAQAAGSSSGAFNQNAQQQQMQSNFTRNNSLHMYSKQRMSQENQSIIQVGETFLRASAQLTNREFITVSDGGGNGDNQQIATNQRQLNQQQMIETGSQALQYYEGFPVSGSMQSMKPNASLKDVDRSSDIQSPKFDSARNIIVVSHDQQILQQHGREQHFSGKQGGNLVKVQEEQNRWKKSQGLHYMGASFQDSRLKGKNRLVDETSNSKSEVHLSMNGAVTSQNQIVVMNQMKKMLPVPQNASKFSAVQKQDNLVSSMQSSKKQGEFELVSESGVQHSSPDKDPQQNNKQPTFLGDHTKLTHVHTQSKEFPLKENKRQVLSKSASKRNSGGVNTPSASQHKRAQGGKNSQSNAALKPFISKSNTNNSDLDILGEEALLSIRSQVKNTAEATAEFQSRQHHSSKIQIGHVLVNNSFSGKIQSQAVNAYKMRTVEVGLASDQIEQKKNQQHEWIRRNETLNIEEIKQNLKDLDQSPEIKASRIPPLGQPKMEESHGLQQTDEIKVLIDGDQAQDANITNFVQSINTRKQESFDQQFFRNSIKTPESTDQKKQSLEMNYQTEAEKFFARKEQAKANRLMSGKISVERVFDSTNIDQRLFNANNQGTDQQVSTKQTTQQTQRVRIPFRGGSAKNRIKLTQQSPLIYGDKFVTNYQQRPLNY